MVVMPRESLMVTVVVPTLIRVTLNVESAAVTNCGDTVAIAGLLLVTL